MAVLPSFVESVRITRPAANIALVTLYRPEAANAIDPRATRAFMHAVHTTESDPTVRVVVLSSDSTKVFCAGADLATIAAGRVHELFPPEAGFAGFVRARRSKPWIAAVGGAAAGGGVELALACELIVCSPEARFSLPEPSVGLAALAGGVQRLPLRIPAAAAMDLLLTGEPIDGLRAWQLGLASRLAPAADLMASAMSTAAAIAANAPGAVQATLRMARIALRDGEEAAWNQTATQEQERLASPEVAEGLRAFLAKRAPAWRP